MSDSKLELKSKPADRRTRRLLWMVAVAAVAVLLLNFITWVIEPKDADSTVIGRNGSHADGESPPLARSFDGSSDRLTQTRIVPALQSPVKAEQSAVWCGTLNLAWRQYQNNVTKGPFSLEGAEKVSDWLNEEPAPELEPEHYYVAAGLYSDGILERIRRELPARFPNAPLPPEPVASPDLRVGLAYSYLEANIKYDFHFRPSDFPLPFKDAQGRTTDVKSFGIRSQDHGSSGYRSQVRVLFRDRNEFAVDLSVGTKPYQIILARIPLKATLGDTLAELDRRIAASVATQLNNHAILFAPTMCWRINHNYRELEKKFIRGHGLHGFDEVDQLLDFRLDHKGAVLVGAARITGTLLNGDEEPSNPDEFYFDRPYLVVMKKRGGRPFFVMWVANAELLYPFK